MSDLAVRSVWRHAAVVFARQPVFFGVMIAVDSAPGLVGLYALPPGDQRIATIVASLLGLYLQLLTTFRVLDSEGLAPPGYQRADATERRYPSAFAASLLSTVAIGVGFALLIVPGLILLALWGVWLPALAAERLSATDALRRSWRLARQRLGIMLLLVASTTALFIVCAGLAVLPTYAPNAATAIVLASVAEIALSAWQIISAVFWVVAYSRLVRAMPA